MSTINLNTCRGVFCFKDKTLQLCVEMDYSTLQVKKYHVYFQLCDRSITYNQQKGGREKGGSQTYFCVVSAGMKDVLEIEIQRINKEHDTDLIPAEKK